MSSVLHRNQLQYLMLLIVRIVKLEQSKRNLLKRRSITDDLHTLYRKVESLIIMSLSYELARNAEL